MTYDFAVAKYDPLTATLRASGDSPVRFTFDELAQLIGGLPPSARTTRPWWGNTVNPRQVHAAAWVSAGWIVQSVDLKAAVVVFAPGRPETRPQARRQTDLPDGASQLAKVLGRAGYPSTMHAVAAHATMLDPSVVAQAGEGSVFATVRRDARNPAEAVGSFGYVGDLPVMFDDNRSASVAFMWAAGYGQPGRDMQYNHIWPSSRDRDAYSALWNLCSTPAFLAKTTDGRNHPEVVAALRRRAFDLYGVLPSGTTEPVAPQGYDDLTWAPHPPAVRDLESAYRRQMSTKKLDRVVVSATEIGWRFSAWHPDSGL